MPGVNVRETAAGKAARESIDSSSLGRGNVSVREEAVEERQPVEETVTEPSQGGQREQAVESTAATQATTRIPQQQDNAASERSQQASSTSPATMSAASAVERAMADADQDTRGKSGYDQSPQGPVVPITYDDHFGDDSSTGSNALESFKDQMGKSADRSYGRNVIRSEMSARRERDKERGDVELGVEERGRNVGFSEAKVAADKYLVNRQKQKWQEKPLPSYVVVPPNPDITVSMNIANGRRFKAAIDATGNKQTIKSAFKQTTSGSSWHDKLSADWRIPSDCCSIGTEILIEAIRDPNSKLIDQVNSATGLDLTAEECLSDISILMNAINGSNIEGVLFKRPVNKRASAQTRRMHVHIGSGIRLNPTQNKGYNADFDGDEGLFTLRQDLVGRCPRSMETLIDVDGTVNLDTDFLPMISVTDEERDNILELLTDETYGEFGGNEQDEIACKEIFGSYFNLMRDYPSASKAEKAELFRKFLRAIDKVAARRSANGMEKAKCAARIFDKFYQFGLKKNQWEIMDASEQEMLRDGYLNFFQSMETEDMHPFAVEMVNITDEIVSGRPAPNMFEFMSRMSKFYAREMKDGKPVDIPKNVIFRAISDYGKAIHRSEFILIGKDSKVIDLTKLDQDDPTQDYTITDLYNMTCSMATSMQIAGRMHTGSHNENASSRARTFIRKNVGLPGNKEKYNGDFQAWLHKFINTYNFMKRTEYSSKSEFAADFRISRDNSYDGISKVKDLGKALEVIYPDLRVRDLFPHLQDFGEFEKNGRTPDWLSQRSGSKVWGKYLDMPVSEFIMNNRIEIDSKIRGDLGIYITDSRVLNEYDVFMILADRRRSDTQDYKKAWEECTNEEAILKFRKAAESIFAEKPNYNDYAYNMVEIIYMMSPDMFLYYGVDDFASFIDSDYGVALLEASRIEKPKQAVERFRSVWLSMYIEYRLGKANSILGEMADIRKSKTLRRNADIDAALSCLSDAYIAELEKLASSSPAWHTIVDEILVKKEDENGTVFHKLKKAKRVIKEKGGKFSFGKRKDNGNIVEDGDNAKAILHFSNAQERWDNVEISDTDDLDSTGTALLDFLYSDASYTDKISVLSDVVRFNEDCYDIGSHEIIGQLVHNPHRLHSGNRFDTGGNPLDKKSVKESASRLQSYSTDTVDNSEDKKKKLVKMAKKDKNAFEVYLYRCATDPGYLVAIDPYLAADAMAATLDPDFADTEKGKQQARVSGFFQCVSLMLSGGMYSHVQQTDNKAVSYIGYDQLTAVDIIRIIGDPKNSMTVYDRYGRPVELSRSTICGGDSVDDVISYIEANPNMVHIFRRYRTGIDEFNDRGSASLMGYDMNYSKMFMNEDSAEQQVFSLLCDRPRFFAMVGLLTPVGKKTGRTVSDIYRDALVSMCGILSNLTEISDPQTALEEFNSFTGLSPQSIMEASREGGFDEQSGLDEAHATDIYNDVVKEFLECLDIVKEAGISSTGFDVGKNEIRIDKNSVISYSSIIQKMNSARTHTMIDIDGAETKKNALLKIHLKNRPDRFFTVNYEYTNRHELVKLGELINRDLVQESRADMLDPDGNGGDIIIDRNEYPELENWTPSDISLASGSQMQSGEKYLELKREKGAEEYNMKAAKFLLDEFNSITKYSKFDSYEGRRVIDSVRNVYKTEGYTAAVYALANELIEADRSLGYIEDGAMFMMSDYLNRADIMIAEYQLEDGTSDITIRSFEQLAAACRSRSDHDTVFMGFDSIKENLRSIVEVTGTPDDPFMTTWPQDDAVSFMMHSTRRNRTASSRTVKRAIFEKASSDKRNIAAVNAVYNKFKKDKKSFWTPWSKSSLREQTKRMLKKLTPSQRNIIKEYVNDNQDNSYELVGTTSSLLKKDKDGSVIFNFDSIQPGPQNLVFINSNDEFNIDDIKRIVDYCDDYGVTVLFENYTLVPDEYLVDTQRATGSLVILPTLYIKVNGSSNSGAGPAPAQFVVHPSNYVVAVEDSVGEIGEGDSAAQATRELGERTRIERGSTEQIMFDDLFPNVIATFGEESVYEFSLCTREEVQKYIVNKFDSCSIDIGVPEGTSDFDEEIESMNNRIEEYVNDFDRVTGQSSFIEGEIKSDRIAGWAKVKVCDPSGEEGPKYAFAPIIPFNRGGAKVRDAMGRPKKLVVTKVVKNDTYNSFLFDWHYSGGIEGEVVKFYYGAGASNKMTISGDYMDSRALANGLPVDIMFSDKTVASRQSGSNKRMNTMCTLMTLPHVDERFAYNFAELSDAFPNSPELKEKLLNGDVSMSEWRDAYESGIKFHNDPEIDALVKFWVKRCVYDYRTVNPSVLLATRSGDGVTKRLTTEYDMFMDTSYNFENALLKLMHQMNENLCPDGLDGDSSKTLFKVNKDPGYDNGVLLMTVPHYVMRDGKKETYYKNEVVNISLGFFGDMYTGFGNTNISADISLDDINVASRLSDEDAARILIVSSREFSPIEQQLMHGLVVDPDPPVEDEDESEL